LNDSGVSRFPVDMVDFLRLKGLFDVAEHQEISF
jgi:hypothetical protein